MTTPAQQYRSLVNKLEQLNELKIGDINPVTGKRVVSGATDSEGNLIASGTPGVYWNAKEEPVAAPAQQPAPAPAPTPAPEPAPAPAPEPAPAPTPAPEPAPPAAAQEKCGPEVKEKIKQQKTFNAAYKMAKDAGCADFDWCQIITVPSSGISGKPSAAPTEPERRRQWNWQSGELTNQPGSDLPPAAEDIELEESSFIPGLIELDRIREIAGTAVVEQTAKPADPKTQCKLCGVAYEQHVRPDGSSVFRHPFVAKKEEGTPSASAASPASNTGEIPEIKASTKEKAIEIAQRQGIKRFRFCGKYKVQDAPTKKPSQGGISGKPSTPTPEPQRRRQFGGLNPNVELGPLGGSDLPIAP